MAQMILDFVSKVVIGEKLEICLRNVIHN